ncbi:MAG TPA: c-type cytochrome [Bacteroidota bacterium]
MGNLAKYFAVVSIAFLVVLAVSPFKDFFREWKGYQYSYNRLTATLPQRVKPAEIGIKQIWVQKLDRIDRCETCHLGLKEDALKNAQEPFRTHPHIHHDIEEFGCTMCHEGQGVATEYLESVGKVKFWDKPMLSREFMEASCGKCHKEKDVPEAPVLNTGRKLIEESNCVGCHKIEGFVKQWVPPLDGIGSKVNRTWLVQWLKNPKQYYPGARMPNFSLSDSDANNLTDFLMSFTASSGNPQLDSLPLQLKSASEAQKTKLAAKGSTIFAEARCISCHLINGRGGYVATELGKVASKVNETWLYNYVKHPKALMPGVQMPRYRFNDLELNGVVAYMESEFVDYDIQQIPPHEADPAAYEKGLALFKKFNCGGCHQLQGISGSGELGPDLTFIGSKKSYEIDFGKTTIEQTLPSYLKTKLLDPRVFSTTARMPNFGFTDDQAVAVSVALLANTNEPIPEEYMVRPRTATKFVPQGEFGKLVNDLACQGCHVMNGTGRLVATDLSMEASQARPEWIKGYFKVPYSLRPILTERMPNLFLSNAEINVLTDYMEKVFVVDSLQRTIAADASTVREGRGLYFERYGCQSCHQVGGKGGYVGPPLDKVGSRLEPGWVFHWLKNPEAYKPGSIEPDNKLTDHEAEALTAYLMTLK